MAGGSGRALGATHDTQAAPDHAPDRLAGFRMLGEGVVIHALANLKLLGLLAGLGGDGLVDVSGHEFL